MSKKYVSPTGPLDANIAIVGEAPGAEEATKGEPFVGASGRLLTDMLARAGIDRRECYITNVIKYRPPRNDFSTFYEKGKPTQELEEAQQKTREELERVGPTVTIPVGNEALRAIVNKKGIMKWRGSILQTYLGKVIPTLHPAYVLRNYSSRIYVEKDLKRALEQSKFPEVRRRAREFIIDPSFSQVIDFLTDVIKNKKTVTFDVETVDTNLRCLGFADSPYHALCIPYKRNINVPGTSSWSDEELTEINDYVREVLENPEIPKVAQNFPFDWRVILDELGIKTKGLEMDTMVAAHCCYSELPKSLDFLTSIYTEIGYYADYDSGSDNSTWTYNCWDVVATYEVYLALKEELQTLKVGEFYKGFAEPVMISLAEASHRGVYVDTKLKEDMVEQYEKDLVDIKERLSWAAGFELNPNSPPQMKKFLYKTLGLEEKRSRKTGSVTTGEDALLKLMAKHPEHAETLQLCLDYREKVKFLGTFLKTKVGRNSRMRTSFNATGTKTGRISSSKTVFGEGGNLQNIPNGPIRRMFTAPPGKILIKADLSQAEARATAWFAGIQKLIERFQDPSFDIHTFNASLIWRMPEEEVDKETRSKAKRVVHGVNYGLSARTSSQITGEPYAETRMAFRNYLKSMPELSMWWKDLESKVKRTRKLRTPHGRLRVFLGRIEPSTFRSAYSFLPQSTVGDIINWAFHRLTERLPAGAHPVLQVHDEIVVECWRSQEDEVMRIMKEEMEMEIPVEGVAVPLKIPTEFKIGENWWDMMEVECSLEPSS